MPRYTYVRGHYRRVSGGPDGCSDLFAGLLGFLFLLLVLIVVALFVLQFIGANAWLVPVGIAGIAGFFYWRHEHNRRLIARYQAEYAIEQQRQQAMLVAEHQRQLAALAAEQQRQHIIWLDYLARQRELGSLLTMTPAEFEQFIAQLLIATGHTQVTVSGKSGDQGVDIHARAPSGHRVIVQCKHYAPGNNVGAPAIQQFLGAILQHSAAQALFVTTADFTPQARQTAQHTDALKLINGDDLVTWVRTVYQQQTIAPAPLPPPYTQPHPY